MFFIHMSDWQRFLRFISRTGPSKGDDITEQILYSHQEAEALVERWSDTVLRIAWTWTGSIHDAQDIVK